MVLLILIELEVDENALVDGVIDLFTAADVVVVDSAATNGRVRKGDTPI